MSRIKQNILDRLINRIVKDHKDCWLWTGPINNAGYGMMNTCKGIDYPRMATVHRIMMVEYTNKIKYGDDVEVLHKCGNKLCVNPDHLTIGDIKDRHKLQRKYKAYNKMFGNSDYMWRYCEHCDTKTYLPHFKRLHSNCKVKTKHK